ncbi:hypothetical protein DH2020_042697 [Rehmannia glutinosa]|uniref:UspA domain-containing protein n=1 Tax=Rehmannia glutinosa TaxID=99300 RepID=A0ABR0ULN8_REHGL
MEGEISMDIEEGQYRNWAATSPEIVEIGEESKSIVVGSRDGGGSDVYVAVGKNDLHVVKWALDHVVSPGSRLFLVHVFPPITYIPTPALLRNNFFFFFFLSLQNTPLADLPVGMLSKSQMSKEQVAVDTMLVESNASAKAILELIPVANITNLVMGTKQSPLSRLSRKGLGKGEYVQKYAPESCEVTVVYDGKKMKSRRSQVAGHSERHFFECVCFSGKFN